MIIDELLHSLGFSRGVSFFQSWHSGSKKPVSFIWKKVNIKMKSSLWLQRERADSKIFELIKEIQGCSLVETVCRRISEHLCLFPWRWWVVYFVANTPYGHEKRKKQQPDRKLNLDICRQSRRSYDLLAHVLESSTPWSTMLS